MKFFTKDFFKFVSGFLAIIAVGFMILFAVRLYEVGGIDVSQTTAAVKSAQ